MNSRSDRYRFETAQPEDGAQILEILEESDFEGALSVLFTRRPDPYVSFKREGGQVDIVICRDTVQGRLVGVGAASINKMFVDGEPRDVGYLFGLRVRKDYRRRYPFLPYGFAYLFSLDGHKNVPFYLTTILEENLEARRLFEKRRASMPVYRSIGDYITYILATGRKARQVPGLIFRRAEAADLDPLIAFLSEQGRRYQFFPVVGKEDIAGCGSPVGLEDFSLVCDRDGRIVAAGALWDQRGYKQYVLKGYGGLFKVLYPFSFLLPLFGYPRLAAPGSVLDLCTLSFWVVKDDDAGCFECLLGHISRLARPFSYLVVGIDTRHPLRRVIERRPHLTYKSRMYLVHTREREHQGVPMDPDKVPYLEIGRL
jgi:hypothetical protein